MHDKKYDQLTPSQREAVFHVDGPLLVIAGPGSGKTGVITYRIAALIDSGVRPYNICAITFTNKAADEMRQRAIALGVPAGVHISTFHSLCVRILRRYADKAAIKPTFSIYDATDQARCIKQAVMDCNLDTGNFSPARMLDAISELKNNLVDIDSFKADANNFFYKILAEIYARYQAILAERNALDFDDLLMKTAILLREHSDVCSELGNRFKYLLIDEYQDTNHAQYKIARSLVSAHNNICVTGDPDQSIYRWRGADIRNILDFESDWPDATIIKLEENFRSTPNILQVADNLIVYNQSRKEKRLVATKPCGEDVLVNVFDDHVTEANGVVCLIEQLIEEGTSLCDIALFYRVNAMSRPLEEALLKNNIPYQIVRGIEFYNRKEIRDLLAYMKVIVNPDDEVALLRIINTPARGIGKTTISRVRAYADLNNITLLQALTKAADIETLPKAAKAKIAVFLNMVEQFKKLADTNSVKKIAKRIFTDSGLEKALAAAGLEGENALENVAELINAAAEYDRGAPEHSLLDYLQQISLYSDADAYDISSERVALMTLHAAKGLEFKKVFITGLEEGILPHERNSKYEDQIEEERRLFFVGITRAKATLFITYCRHRSIRGQSLRTVPSPFLYELGIDRTKWVDENQYYDETDENDSAEINHGVRRFASCQLVKHEKFGLGRVKKFTDMGENSIVVVKFNSGETKSLMVKYANLLEL